MCDFCKDKPDNIISYLMLNNQVIWITKENLKKYTKKGFNCFLHLNHTPCDMKKHNERIIKDLFSGFSKENEY